MAKPKLLRGTYVSILLGNGAQPEVFQPLCGLTTKGFTAQTNTSDDFVRDCADPEDIPDRYVTATGQQWDMSGSGLIDRNNLETLLAAQGKIKNWRYVLGEPADDEVFGGYWAGAGMLTNLQFGGPDDAKATIDVTIVSDGPWTFVEV